MLNKINHGLNLSLLANKSKKYIFIYLFFFLFFYCHNSANSQSVGISADSNYIPDPSSILDLNSISLGLLVPRMTYLQRIAILSPANALLVFQTDDNGSSFSGFWYYHSSDFQWYRLGTFSNIQGPWFLNGNASTNPANQFIGTTDAQSMVFRTNNIERMRLTTGGTISLGNTTPDPSAILELNTSSRGILFPRLTTANRAAIALPAPYLTIFNTTTSRFEFNYGTAIAPMWIPMLDSVSINGLGWGLQGNTGIIPSSNFFGTTDANDLVIKTNNSENLRILGNSSNNNGYIGIKESNPSQQLTIKGNLLIEPNGSSANQLRFAVPSDTSHYTAFKAQTQKSGANQIVYTLPDTQAVAPLGFLANDGTGSLKWAKSSEIASLMQVPVRTVTGQDTAHSNDYIIIIRSDQNYYVPAPSSSNVGRIYYFLTDCASDDNDWTIRVVGGGSQINCSTSYSPQGQVSGVMIISDGSMWHIVTTRRLN